MEEQMDSPRKVLIGIPCLMLGGSEIATLQMADALIAAGYRVKLLCYYEFDPAMLQRYRKHGVEVELLQERRGGPGGLWRLFRRLVARFRVEKPEVVHIQYFAPGMVPILAARLAGVKRVFATVHAAGGNGYGWKAKAMFRFSAVWVSHFFCVSCNTERFWFGTCGGKRHSTIHNGIDVEWFSRAEPVEISGISPNDVVVGIVGRIVKLKGHDCLFRSMKRLLSEISNLKVLVVGDGADRPYFEEMAGKLQIEDRIVWAGRVEPEALPGYYKRLDVLAMPSHWEGFGLTAAEAMAAGVPVAASDVPGLREVVGGAGLLFPVNDDAVMAECLRRLLAGKHDFSLNAVQRVKDHFSLPGQQQKWRDAYQR